MTHTKQKRNTPKFPFAVTFDREEDGRWIAEVPKLPGVLAYGATRREALRSVYAIALRTLAEIAEDGGPRIPFSDLFSHEMARR